MTPKGKRAARTALMLAGCAAALAPAAPPIARGAPFCAAPGTRPMFLSPMGEPFRAASGQPVPVAQWFADADRNKDGAVDRAEFVADARRFFRRIDRDGDGRLVPEEVAAYERDVAPEIALYGTRREPERLRGRSLAEDLGIAVGGSAARTESADYGGPMGAGRFAWLNIPEPVAAADADIDRIVTADEFAAAASRRFDALDGTHAGVLRLAGMPRTPAQIALEGPCRPRPKPKRGPPPLPGDPAVPGEGPPL